MLSSSDRLNVRRTRDGLSKDFRLVTLRYASQDTTAEANWDGFSHAPKDVSATENEGQVRNIVWKSWTANVGVEWTTGRRYHPLSSGGATMLGDCLLYIRPVQEGMFQKLYEHPDSYVLVDGRTMKPIEITPVAVGGLTEFIVQCKIFVLEGT